MWNNFKENLAADPQVRRRYKIPDNFVKIEDYYPILNRIFEVQL